MRISIHKLYPLLRQGLIPHSFRIGSSWRIIVSSSAWEIFQNAAAQTHGNSLAARRQKLANLHPGRAATDRAAITLGDSEGAAKPPEVPETGETWPDMSDLGT